jgi:acetoin utilization deacetylase AcuC-like enzyme
MIQIFYCDHHEIPLPAGHKFPLRKYRLLREILERDPCFSLAPAPAASFETICLAHDPEYVRGFLEGKLPPGVMRRIGFPWSEGLVRRTLASVGGTLAAAEVALSHGLGGTLAGGTHHAFRGEGAGFCVFNDVAIAIHALRSRGLAQRFAIVDLDVHQGDGTAHFFEHDPGVLTLSLHGKNNFPFRKQRSRLDVELKDGTGDEEYLAALDAALPRVWEFGPEFVFYLSGVDALAEDRLGRLALTLEGLKSRDQKVLEGVKARRLTMAITLGGGYAEPIELAVEAHANTFLAAVAAFERAETIAFPPQQRIAIEPETSCSPETGRPPRRRATLPAPSVRCP